jgi:hypothetical protein
MFKGGYDFVFAAERSSKVGGKGHDVVLRR